MTSLECTTYIADRNSWWRAFGGYLSAMRKV